MRAIEAEARRLLALRPPRSFPEYRPQYAGPMEAVAVGEFCDRPACYDVDLQIWANESFEVSRHIYAAMSAHAPSPSSVLALP